MEFLTDLIDIFLHIDLHLTNLANSLEYWLYLVLFLIVFCETGLVVTPFLPGDSLLFAVGALAAVDNSELSLPVLLLLLILAAILGDAVNYSIGYYLGPKVFKSEHSWLFHKKHLERTQAFYQKHGGKTIILARFIPLIRTFAPFVAGIGRMKYREFGFYNIVGGVAWVALFLLGGYFLGNMPAVKQNFHIVIVAIILISVLPIAIEYFNNRRKNGVPASEVPAHNAESVPVESK